MSHLSPLSNESRNLLGISLTSPFPVRPYPHCAAMPGLGPGFLRTGDLRSNLWSAPVQAHQSPSFIYKFPKQVQTTA